MSLMVETTRRVFGIPEGIPLLGIVNAEKKGWEARKRLMERFHFPEDGRIKFNIRASMQSTYHVYLPIIEVFRAGLSGSAALMVKTLLEDPEIVTTNCCPDGSKLSRRLAASLNEDRVLRELRHNYTTTKELLPALPSDAASVTVASLLAVFFEAVQSREMVFTLSMNPADYMEASHDAVFKSCYSPGGQYEVAPLQYATSPDTLICFGHRPDVNKKIFRAWVYVDAKVATVIIGRVYGSVTNVILAGLIDKISTRGKLTVQEQHFRSGMHFEVAFNGSDVPVLVYRDTPSIMAGLKVSERTRVRLNAVHCAVCGEVELSRTNDIICAACAKKYRNICGLCGSGSRELSVREDGSLFFCKSCLANSDVCSVCGKRHYKNDLRSDPDGACICHACFDKRYVTCRRCGKIEVKKKDSGYVKGLCSDCAASVKVGVCTGCGANHDISEHGGFFEENYYCNNCLAWTFAEYIQAHIKNGRLQG